jgi:hypothetical protein
MEQNLNPPNLYPPNFRKFVMNFKAFWSRNFQIIRQKTHLQGGLYIYRRKNLRNFTILSSNTSSANIAEFFITNYFVGVMNDVIFKIEFLKFTLFNFHFIAFGGVLGVLLRILVINFIRTNCKTPYKIENLFDT